MIGVRSIPDLQAVSQDSADVDELRGEITSQILVAGIGNIFLGDDGFGPEVVRRVPDSVAGPDVRVVDYGIRGMHLAYDLLDGLGRVGARRRRARPRGTGRSCTSSRPTTKHSRRDTGLDAHAMDPAAVFASLAALGGDTAVHRRGRL